MSILPATCYALELIRRPTRVKTARKSGRVPGWQNRSGKRNGIRSSIQTRQPQNSGSVSKRVASFPGLHCVVTDGRRWIAARRGYLLPVKVLGRSQMEQCPTLCSETFCFTCSTRGVSLRTHQRGLSRCPATGDERLFFDSRIGNVSRPIPRNESLFSQRPPPRVSTSRSASRLTKIGAWNCSPQPSGVTSRYS